MLLQVILVYAKIPWCHALSSSPCLSLFLSLSRYQPTSSRTHFLRKWLLHHSDVALQDRYHFWLPDWGHTYLLLHRIHTNSKDNRPHLAFICNYRYTDIGIRNCLNTQTYCKLAALRMISPLMHRQSLANPSLFFHFRSGARHHLQDQHLYVERERTQCTSHTHRHHG